MMLAQSSCAVYKSFAVEERWKLKYFALMMSVIIKCTKHMLAHQK